MVTNRYVVLGVVTADHGENPEDMVSLNRKTTLKGKERKLSTDTEHRL